MTQSEIKARAEAIQYIIDNELFTAEMEGELHKEYMHLTGMLRDVEDEVEEEDKINPQHYKLPIIVFKAVAKNQDAYEGFLHLNAVKYLHRCYHKHGTPKTDLEKAKWYIDKMLEELDGNTVKDS